MPIISSFTGIAARGFGFTNGLPPLPPTDISFVTSELNAVVAFTTTPTSYPVDIVQAKIMQGATLISDWATVTSGGNISASNLTPALVYTAYFRTRDTGGQISQEVSQTFTTSIETPPGAPTFSLAVASSDAGTFKFNITWTAGTAGTYSRITQYRVETSAGAQLLDWTTISSSPIAYGADTYNGAGALSPATTYKVRLRSVAATSGTITYAAYQTVTTNAIVAPNAPTSLSATPVAGTSGEFSFTFSHTPGTARSYPVYGSQYRIRTGVSTYLSGYSSYQEFSGTITIGTSSYVSANLTPGTTYYIDTRTYDTLGTFSTVTSTSVTLTAQRVPGAPTFSLAVASGDAGSFKFNITSTGGTIGSYPRITQYRIETSAGAQLLDWTTISSNSSTVTAYGADTYNGAGALSPATTYSVRLRSVAATSGTITNAAYQTVTTNAIVAPNAPTGLSATPVATGYQGEFSFTFSHTPGTARSYPVSGSEYRIRTGVSTYLSGYSSYQNFSGIIAIGTSTYLNAILTPGTTYYIDTRTYDTLGTRSGVTSTSVTLAAKRNPGTPTGLAAVKVATGNQGEFSFTFSHTTVAGSYPVSASQYRIRTGASTYLSGYSSYQNFSGTVTIGTSTYLDAILSPGSTYYVDTRTYDTQGNYSTVASDDVILTAKRDPTAGSVTVVAPTYNGTNTSTLSVTLSDFTAGSWPIDDFEYNLDNGNSYTALSGNSVGGLAADTEYTVYVRAVDTQGNGSAKASGTATTNAALPPTPTIAWRSMSGSSYGTAQFTISGNGGSTTTVKIARRTTSGSDTGATFVTKATGNQDITGYASNGGREYYVAYNYNKHGSQSTASNQISWKRPEKGKPWDSGYIQTSAIYFSTTANCTSEFSYTFGTVPSSNDEPGYIAVNKLSVQGIQQTGTNLNGCAYMGYTVANLSHLTWVSDSFHPNFTADIYGTSSTAGFSGSWPNGSFGTVTTGTLSNHGGSNISGKFFQVRTSLGSRTAGCAVGCGSYNGTTLQTYRMKNFILEGIQTLSGTVYN
jgi:hypothetical protein